MDLQAAVAAVQASPYFNGPLTFSYEPGSGPLVVVTGRNASGKSVLRKFLTGVYGDKGVLFMDTSMQDRCSASGLKRAMMYGSEEDESTGYLSVRSVLKALQTSQGNERDHVLFLDEPDLGLSEEAAAGIGRRLADYSNSPGPKCLGVYVVTHSRPLVRQLVWGTAPHHFRLGDDSLLRDWLDRDVVPADLDALLKEGKETWARMRAARRKRQSPT